MKTYNACYAQSTRIWYGWLKLAGRTSWIFSYSYFDCWTKRISPAWWSMFKNCIKNLKVYLLLKNQNRITNSVQANFESDKWSQNITSRPMARFAWDNALRWEQTLFCTPKFKTRVDAYIPFLCELERNPHFTLLMKCILYSYENTKPLIWIYVYNLHPHNLDGRSRYDWSQERSCSRWLGHLPPGCTVTICCASVHNKTPAKLTRPGHGMDGKRWVSCAIICIVRNLEEGNLTILHQKIIFNASGIKDDHT